MKNKAFIIAGSILIFLSIAFYFFGDFFLEKFIKIAKNTRDFSHEMN